MKPVYLRDCEQGSRVTLANDGTPHDGHPVIVVGNYGHTTGVVVVRSERDGATFERDGYTEVTPSAPTFADDLRAMMSAWDTIKARARAAFPNASEDEIDKITGDAMNHALGFAP